MVFGVSRFLYHPRFPIIERNVFILQLYQNLFPVSFLFLAAMNPCKVTVRCWILPDKLIKFKVMLNEFKNGVICAISESVGIHIYGLPFHVLAGSGTAANSRI